MLVCVNSSRSWSLSPQWKSIVVISAQSREADFTCLWIWLHLLHEDGVGRFITFDIMPQYAVK